MPLEPPAGPTQATLIDRWAQIVSDHPELFEDALERVETDAFGNILISPPPDPTHQKLWLRIAILLETLLPGDGTVYECAIVTDAGIKIPDVIWLAPERADELQQNKPISPAPDICVEVRSPGNTIAELHQKRDAYLRAGAKEVWICDSNNRMTFFDPRGEISESKICPDFPLVIQPYRQ
jgi:Uma2 family endonuclease